MNEMNNGDEFRSEEEKQAAKEFGESQKQTGEIEKKNTLESMAVNPESIGQDEVELMRIMVEIADTKKGIEEGHQIIRRANETKYRGANEDAMMQISLNDRAEVRISTLKRKLQRLLAEQK